MHRLSPLSIAARPAALCWSSMTPTRRFGRRPTLVLGRFPRSPTNMAGGWVGSSTRSDMSGRSAGRSATGPDLGRARARRCQSATPWCPLMFSQQNLRLCTYVGLRGVRWTDGLASRPAPTAPSQQVTDGVNTLRGAGLMAAGSDPGATAATSNDAGAAAMTPGDTSREMDGDPSQEDPQDDETSAQDQSSADRDQTFSDGDQADSDRDQAASNVDQLAADEDQAASDRDLAHGLDARRMPAAGRPAYSPPKPDG